MKNNTKDIIGQTVNTDTVTIKSMYDSNAFLVAKSIGYLKKFLISIF